MSTLSQETTNSETCAAMKHWIAEDRYFLDIHRLIQELKETTLSIWVEYNKPLLSDMKCDEHKNKIQLQRRCDNLLELMLHHDWNNLVKLIKTILNKKREGEPIQYKSHTIRCYRTRFLVFIKYFHQIIINIWLCLCIYNIWRVGYPPWYLFLTRFIVHPA